MSFLIHRRSARYRFRSSKTSQRQYYAIHPSDIPPSLNCPKISDDISTRERLAPNVSPEALPGRVGRLRLPFSRQSCWQQLFYFHNEINLPCRSQFKQVRPTRLWRTRSRCYPSTISAKKQRTPILPTAFKGISSQIY